MTIINHTNKDAQTLLETSKIIDIDVNGATIRLFTTESDENVKDAWGDDWNDRPYEHNADEVYSRYVDHTIDIHLPYEIYIWEPYENYQYHGNSPYAKEDFKNRKYACAIISQHDMFEDYYHQKDRQSDDLYLNLLHNENSYGVFHGDTVQKMIDGIKRANIDIVAIVIN